MIGVLPSASVDFVHATLMAVVLVPVAVTPVGTEGGLVSAVVANVLEAVWALVFPAGSTASTLYPYEVLGLRPVSV